MLGSRKRTGLFDYLREKREDEERKQKEMELPVNKQKYIAEIVSILASIWAVIGIILFFANILDFNLGGIIGSLVATLVCLAALAAGLYSLHLNKIWRARRIRYLAIINWLEREHSIDEIAETFGTDYEQCSADLEKLIRDGDLGSAYVDYRRRVLVTNA